MHPRLGKQVGESPPLLDRIRLQVEVAKLHANRIRLKVVGDTSRFDRRIRDLIAAGEALTAQNDRLTLTVAANYGGRWDVAQAARRYFSANPDALIANRPLVPEAFEPYLAMAYAPEPDLFIRTGGEKRISNFLLWQLAYTELYFTDTYWPDFGREDTDIALAEYGRRKRKFGALLPEDEAAFGKT